MNNFDPGKFKIWLTKFSIVGIMIIILKFAFQSIAQLEIQALYQATIKPFFLKEISISLNLFPNRLQLLGGSLLVLITIAFLWYLSLHFIKRKMINELPNGLTGIPQVIVDRIYNRIPIKNIEIIKAISANQAQEFIDVDLATIIMYAVNDKIITKRVGNEALEETNFTLININGNVFFALKQ